jgi:hypothetical protein
LGSGFILVPSDLLAKTIQTRVALFFSPTSSYCSVRLMPVLANSFGLPQLYRVTAEETNSPSIFPAEDTRLREYATGIMGSLTVQAYNTKNGDLEGVKTSRFG